MAATGGRRREVSDRVGDGRHLRPPLAGKLQESFFFLLFGRPFILIAIRAAGDTSPLWEDVMKGLVKKVQRFLVAEDGPTAVEYAVMLALIVVVCIGAITTLGSKASTTFAAVSAQLPS